MVMIRTVVTKLKKYDNRSNKMQDKNVLVDFKIFAVRRESLIRVDR